MQTLERNFQTRKELIEYVKIIAPWANGKASSIIGGNDEAKNKMQKIDPVNYGKTRNFADGKITKLSPYIHHGAVSLNEVRNCALTRCLEKYPEAKNIEKFIQELAWRDFWQRIAKRHPEWIWSDVEEYKTGHGTQDYSPIMPEDILNAKTGSSFIDACINDLVQTGYLHNHVRMYLASYVVHFRKIKWQAGAHWFLEHLLDGDEASNNFSWQWVASTFSNKPYIFNLENADKYFGKFFDTSSKNNIELDASYEELTKRLFPNIGGFHD